MTPISVNSNIAHPIKSDLFDGQITVHFKGFPDENGDILESEYFEREGKQNLTWSIQVQGTFVVQCFVTRSSYLIAKSGTRREVLEAI